MEVLIYLAIGMLLGYFLIPKSWKKPIGFLQSAAMVATLFFMGVSLGSQSDLLGSLKESGILALVFALTTTAGSIAVVYLVERKFFRKKKQSSDGKEGAE